MSRVRWPLLILGLVGTLAVMVAVVLVVRLGRGTPVQLPVAIGDIPPGTPLEPRLFRLTQVRGLDPSTLAAVITAEEFGQYVDKPVMETVHAGAPVLKAQVRTDVPNEWQSRLTLLLSDPSHLVYPVPVDVDQVGNYIVAGDRVDVVFTLGRVAAQELEHAYEVPAIGPRGIAPVSGTRRVTTSTVSTQTGPRPGEVVTETMHLPVAKVILPDVRVLRVEREVRRTTSATYGVTREEAPQQAEVEGDVIRLYLEVNREQAEVLSFALHNGSLNLPARAQPAGGTTEGFTWEDFVEMIFRDRSAPWEEEGDE